MSVVKKLGGTTLVKTYDGYSKKEREATQSDGYVRITKKEVIKNTNPKSVYWKIYWSQFLASLCSSLASSPYAGMPYCPILKSYFNEKIR
ncbi:MAG TPA: hypothetical protein VF884_08860 [Nitrososphaeraceae archaeon]